MSDVLESATGKIFVILYALLSIASYIGAFVCGTDACAVYLVVPILPWGFVMTHDLGLPFPWGLYPIFVLLNASVAYALGAGVEWMYRYLYGDER